MRKEIILKMVAIAALAVLLIGVAVHAWPRRVRTEAAEYRILYKDWGHNDNPDLPIDSSQAAKLTELLQKAKYSRSLFPALSAGSTGISEEEQAYLLINNIDAAEGLQRYMIRFNLGSGACWVTYWNENGRTGGGIANVILPKEDREALVSLMKELCR